MLTSFAAVRLAAASCISLSSSSLSFAAAVASWFRHHYFVFFVLKCLYQTNRHMHFVCPRVCCQGALPGQPAAPGASEGDHPAGGGGAGHPAEPDAAAATADPRRRQTDAQSAGQKRTLTYSRAVFKFFVRTLFAACKCAPAEK